MMIALSSDHAGFPLKEAIKEYFIENNIEFEDCGAYSTDSVDYPYQAKKACDLVVSGKCDKAILCCGTGIGISMAANKVKGIRAAMCTDVYSAKMTKQHNNTNVLCLGGRVTGRELAFMIIDAWLETEFEGGRHADRVAKIHKIEETQ